MPLGNWEGGVSNEAESEELPRFFYCNPASDRFRLVRWDGGFNYSAINNYGIQYAKGEYILLLNNDTEVIEPDSLRRMLAICQRSEVGIVGAKLLYDDNTVQHAGIVIGYQGAVAVDHRLFHISSPWAAGWSPRQTDS